MTTALIEWPCSDLTDGIPSRLSHRFYQYGSSDRFGYSHSLRTIQTSSIAITLKMQSADLNEGNSYLLTSVFRIYLYLD